MTKEKIEPENEKKYLIEQLSESIKKTSQIDKQLFEQYNVKRGLRNLDHSGVLVGLTNIGDVVGYKKEGNKIIPVDGVLTYRGINIKKIVAGFQKDKRHGFDEVTYLLLSGTLPNKKELEDFQQIIGNKRELPMYFTKNMILSFAGQDMMNMLARCVLVLYTKDERAEDKSHCNLVEQSLSLIAKFPIFVAYSYRGMQHSFYHKTLSIRNPNPEMSTAENFLYILKGKGRYTKLDADILDLSLVLHAEHGGGNNSSFAIRVTSSSGTDTYSAVSSALASLKGPLHGGANIKVLEMMKNIRNNVKDITNREEIRAYLLKILRKEANDKTGKIYGIGHAVYTLSDPRSVLLKKKAKELAKEKGKLDEFELYETVETLAPEVFAEFKGDKAAKVLCANVDFYSGFVYDCIGIPKELFTPLFAIARISGWCAHRLEELSYESRRIIRPAYKNVYGTKEYVPIAKR